MAILYRLLQASFSHRNRKVLDSVSLELPEGGIFVLLGHNGAGKTTLLQLLAGLLRPISGSCSAPGLPAGSLVGYCPQQVAVWDRLTVAEQLDLAAALYGLPVAEYHANRQRLVEALMLEPELDCLAGDLSRGIRRKLNLALSLIHNPTVLLLDEPDAELDIVTRASVVDLLSRLGAEPGRTIVLSTHHVQVAERLADRIGILHNGHLVASGDRASMVGASRTGPQASPRASRTLERLYIDLTGGGN